MELREIIYDMVSETSLQDNTITPDPAHHRRECSKDDVALKQRTISNVLGLLLLCRKAHEEAMEALYSKHVFYFDDIQHGSYEIKVEASAHCYYCRPSFPGPCFNSSQGRHYVRVPYCDFVSMQGWLIAIGEKNRMRIRHIQLHFHGPRFVKFLGERHEWFPPVPQGKPCPVGGEFLAKALELLGSAHNLETLRISFDYPPRDEASNDPQCGINTINNRRIWSMQAFDLLFQPEKPRNLKNALCTVTGIKRLVYQDMRDAKNSIYRVTDGARAGLKEVREAMEFGHPSRLKPGESLAYTQAPSTGKWSNRWKVSGPWPETCMRRF